MSSGGFVLLGSVPRRAEDCALLCALPLATPHPALPGGWGVWHPQGIPQAQPSVAFCTAALPHTPSPATFADTVLTAFPLLLLSSRSVSVLPQL